MTSTYATLARTMFRVLPLIAFSTVVEATPFRVEIVDRENGWPVPMVELRTTSGLSFVSDNAGLIALDAPEIQEREVFLHVRSHGYRVPADGFGYHGVRLTPQENGGHRIELERTIIAKRLGRLTGSGLFAESAKLGVPDLPAESGVVGCDSIQLATYRGRLFHLWGDTTLFHYPLGVFDSTAATTTPRPFDRFEPPLVPAYKLFRDENQRPRAVSPIPGDGPTWLGGMISLKDESGTERLVATYAKIRPPLDEYEVGLCVWNDDYHIFERLKTIWNSSEPEKPATHHGHPVRWSDPEGEEWVLFGDPFPILKCRATFESWQDFPNWQPIAAPEHPRSAADGEPIEPHRGSIAWNEKRRKWICVFTRKFGEPSAFGEIWFTEADSPLGPWAPCVKILSHDNYTFYNPRIDREYTAPDADFIVFEGTYTATFAADPEPTPRYDYNQILYRLDFADLPQP